MVGVTEQSEPKRLPPDMRLWTIDDIAGFLDIGKSTAYQLAAKPTFPRSIRLTGKVRRWSPDEVRRWTMEQR